MSSEEHQSKKLNFILYLKKFLDLKFIVVLLKKLLVKKDFILNRKTFNTYV